MNTCVQAVVLRAQLGTLQLWDFLFPMGVSWEDETLVVITGYLSSVELLAAHLKMQ